MSDIVRVETHQRVPVSATVADKTSDEAESWNHVFEIHCSSGTVYYVGEDPEVGSSARCMVRSVQSGSGLDLAKSWETAIRQARLPLNLDESTASSVETAISDLTLDSMLKYCY